MNGYVAPPWLPGAHAQTILPALWPWPRVGYYAERWNAPDGDFIDVHWAGPANASRLLVFFHGLEGNSSGAYARRIGAEALRRGWRFAVPHFRGCSGELNRALPDYHSGASGEVDWILREFVRRHHGPVYAGGVSLGANALLKWLGELRASAANLVRAAVAVSAPLDLTMTGAVLARGFSRFYGKQFLCNNLRWKALRKLEPDMYPGAYDGRRVRAAKVLRDFEDAVTAPVNGFLDARDYWVRSSAGQFLDAIAVHTLLINARNDPFLPDHVLRGVERRRQQIPAMVEFDFPNEGGHAGFADGDGWLGKRVADFLAPF
jgi:predicted alpha/beta-fold hydrolase